MTRRRKEQDEKRRSAPRPVFSDNIRRIPIGAPGKFADQDGGFIRHEPGRPQLPLSQRESRRLELSTNPRDSVSSKCIYQVRAWQNERGSWSYEGRSYNHVYPVPLTAQWLTENKMGGPWRKHTIQKYQCFWFKCHVFKTPDEQRPGCIPLSIFLFYKHVGMHSRAAEFHRRWRDGFHRWGECVDLVRRLKGFCQKKPNCREFTNNILDLGQQKHLFVIQLSSISLTNRSLDNLHAICVFDGLIFDANAKNPLPLTRKNLDKCCLGGADWVFDHVSRVREFAPSIQTCKHFAVFAD